MKNGKREIKKKKGHATYTKEVRGIHQSCRESAPGIEKGSDNLNEGTRNR